MNNVLFDPLPTSWNGFPINTGFQIGVQLSLCLKDDSLSDEEKMKYSIYLLFSDSDGNIKELPTTDGIVECLTWFMSGWNHDNTSSNNQKNEYLVDFNIDQGRIYADFRQIYHINLNDCDLHWWEFCWMLWNMPQHLSSFLQVIEIRRKKPGKHASAEEKQAIVNAKKVYGLTKKKDYSEEEKSAIDRYDEMMKRIKERKKVEQLALKEFRR